VKRQKSQLAQTLDTLQVATHSFLKPLGFRKKGRSHNRHSAGGLTHVVTFQMGQYPIGDNHVISRMRESYYGQFWVNLAVFLPCVYEVERQQPPPDFVQEYDCTIRQRLGTLAFGEDRCFDLTSDTMALTKELVVLLDRFGLIFLEQFQTYQDALSYYDRHGNLPFQNMGRASLEAAIIAFHMGNKTLSASLLAKAHATNQKGFQQHVAEIARRIGLTID
jgi:hypothetical protein